MRFFAFIVLIAIGILFVAGTYTPAPREAPGALQATPEPLTLFYEQPGQFSISVPQSYVVDEFYHYQGLGPGKTISGVQFIVGTSTTVGTNLSSDTYISIEYLPFQKQCRADLFLFSGTATTTSESGVSYSVASTTGAAAGNRYEETVYALPNTNPCIAVRYFIHYGDIGNYPPGDATEFNREALVDQFDSIRRTLELAS